MKDEPHIVKQDRKYNKFKTNRKVQIKACQSCGNDMTGRGVVKFHYEGPGTQMSIVCECGMQTKKVLMSAEITAYDIWNRRPKKK